MMPRFRVSSLVFCSMLLLGGLCSSSASAARTPKKISIDLKDAEIHNVLRLLSDVSGANIVVSEAVKGKVTLKLKNVAWTRALQVVLRSKSLGMVQEGNIIEVDTLERINARVKLRAELAALRTQSGALVTVMLPLSYAKAADIAKLVQPMLTERGSVSIDARTNTLIVTDVAHNAGRVRALVGRR